MGPKFVMGIAQPFLNRFVCSESQNLQKICGYPLNTKGYEIPMGHPWSSLNIPGLKMHQCLKPCPYLLSLSLSTCDGGGDGGGWSMMVVVG